MRAPFETGRDDADLAAEYALGVLDGAARRAVERRAERDLGFSREIDDWQARLAPLGAAVAEVSPPSAVWTRIAADLDRMRRPFVRDGAEAAGPVPVSVHRGGRRVSAVWQWLGLGGMGLAVASLAALIAVGPMAGRIGGPEARLPAAARLTATLSSSAGTALATVVIDPANGTATLIPIADPGTAGRVPELWLVPSQGSPKSLGLLDMSKPLRLEVRAEGVEQPQAALAVSMEPPGGSPTGLPTGPVVASGALNRI